MCHMIEVSTVNKMEKSVTNWKLSMTQEEPRYVNLLRFLPRFLQAAGQLRKGGPCAQHASAQLGLPLVAPS